jgi:hypothetical protein
MLRLEGATRGAVAGGRRHRTAAAVIVTSARLSERDVVTVTKVALTGDALTVDVRSVEAAQVAQRETVGPALDDAMLLRHNLVEELHRVGRMTPERVVIAELDHLLSFRGDEHYSGHASQTG